MSPEEDFSVCVVYRHTAEGFRTIKYAHSLARLLNAALLVFVAGVNANPVQTYLADQLHLTDFDCIPFRSTPPIPAHAIVVDARLAASGAITNPSLAPGYEDDFLARGKGPVMVPFGEGTASRVSAALAIWIARQANLKVLFYHTTWREPGVLSESAADHMCQQAKDNWDKLKDMADEAEVAHETVVEMADKVVVGMVSAALRKSSQLDPVSLIVVARRVSAGIGCYAKQAVAESPIPVLVVNAAEGGANV